MRTKITASNLWLLHREAAGGASTITGAPLPSTIDDCAAGPQATHYAMACYIAAVHGENLLAVPIPSKVPVERAAELRAIALRFGKSVGGLATALEGVERDLAEAEPIGSA